MPRKALEYNPNHPSALWWLALAHEQKREFPEAIEELEKAVRLSGEGTLYRALLANGYALAGKRDKALTILDGLRALSRQRYVSPLDMAIVYTGLGDRNSAFQWLEKAYQDRAMRLRRLPQPHFDSLRSDTRFQDLMTHRPSTLEPQGVARSWSCRTCLVRRRTRTVCVLGYRSSVVAKVQHRGRTRRFTLCHSLPVQITAKPPFFAYHTYAIRLSGNCSALPSSVNLSSGDN